MAELHDLGIIHDDLKPENILLSDTQPPRNIKITDFGLSLLRPELAGLLTISNLQMSYVRESTPLYRAPEILSNRSMVKPSRSTDMFSYGVMAYEIVSGHNPFGHAKSIPELLKMVCEDTYRPSFECISEIVPPEMIEVIDLCWHDDREKRLTAVECCIRIEAMMSSPSSSSLESQGRVFFPDGSVYMGAWQDGKRHGRGRCTYLKNGVSIQDLQVDEKRFGTCSFDGDVYVGEWENDERHGSGKLTEQNGDVYDGAWLHDKKHGSGKLTKQNGDVYDGAWLHDLMHGDGRYFYADGRIYTGSWEQDRRHGLGVCTYPDGRVCDELWDKGNIAGAVTCSWPDGTKYVGAWLGDKRHGPGRCAFANGSVYEGEWANDKENGKGACRYSSGDTYDGDWQDGLRHGQGIYRSDDGVYDGG